MAQPSVLIACLFSLLGTAWSAESAARVFIAPTGSDANPGTQAKPFATLERARDAARTSKGAIVELAAGTYRLTQTLALDDQDSGTTYRAADGATVRITGGIDVPASAIQRVADQAILARIITEAARPHLMQLDLKKLGVTSYGDLGPRGFGRPYASAPLELFINEQPCQIARWPNAGQPQIKLGKVIDRGSIPRKKDYAMKPGVFAYVTPRAARWTQAEDLYISGIFGESWADDTLPVAKIDTQAGTITTTLPHHYGFKSQSFTKWFAINLLEEIDVPGEYYVDRAAGMLYVYPPAGVDLAKARIQVSILSDVLVAVEGASQVRFERLTFENSRGNGLYLERGTGNRIDHCTFRNLGGLGVQMGQGAKPTLQGRNDQSGDIDGGSGDSVPVSRIMGDWVHYIYAHTAWNRQAGTDHGIVGSSFYNLGSGGVVLSGGDRKALTPGSNFVRDCDIHHVNRFDRTYRACINVDGVGNIIEHNRLHDTEGQAILLHGNDHRIEYNRIFEVCLDISDMGAFYMGRDCSETGNLIRYNFFHHITSHHTGGAGVQAIFFDDSSIYGATVQGNVFYKTGNEIVIKFNGGGGSPIINNIFIDCPTPTKGGTDSMARVMTEMKSARGKERLRDEVDILKPPYSTRYPDLAAVYNGKLKVITPFERNWVVTGDTTKFVDAAKLDFTLKSGADPGVPGFEPIPFDKIAKD